jgi:hypothetical protein
MRMMVEVALPVEPFNQMVKDGTAGAAIEKALADIRPEAVYFKERSGMRSCTMIVDMTDASQMPKIAEPFFLMFNAMVDFEPVMTPEDLARSGLDELGKKYA